VWDHETTEEAVIEAFDPEEFRAVSLVPYGKQGIHFLPRGEKGQGSSTSFFTPGRAIGHPPVVRRQRQPLDGFAHADRAFSRPAYSCEREVQTVA